MNASAQEIKKQSKFKNACKALLPSYIIAFVFCFMLFIYEPLLMYSTNQLDFWFDMALMIGPVLLGFLAAFLGCVLVLTAVYFINRAFSKEPSVYRIFAVVLFLVMFVTYVQGNFLSGNLPALDGSVINWSEFAKNDIITVGIAAVAAGVLITLLVRKGTRKTLFVTMIASAGVFALLLVSLVFELISWNAFVRKDSVITTNRNFDQVSADTNFIIILNDAVGSSEFNSVLEKYPEYKEVFEDFTYYPDTLGCFPCTRDTIPVVLGGAVNTNEMDFDKFSSNAMNNSPLFKELDSRGYEINLYESELVWYGAQNFDIVNSTNYTNYTLPFKTFWKEQLKYVGYKYLPYTLKKYSEIESMDFNGLIDKYLWDFRSIYNDIETHPELQKTDKKSFRFVHTEGAHIPFKYDKYGDILEGYSDYETEIEATIHMTNEYIKRLKENGAYDNSVIIVMADHGNTDLNDADDMLVRANPMFLVKGINEHHAFEKSDKPLSYTDLTDIYTKLLDGKSAKDACADIPDKRERFFMWYRNFRLEDHIEEYVVTDKAWEWQKFKKTGREFDL